ncbi:MAG: FKBP-type peptidyl-prolyl cis-trans isomerase [Panacibacter sp.]
MKKMPAMLLLMGLFFGCSKSNNSATCTDVNPATEEPQIISFAASNGITATKDASGLYYQIINPGTTPMPDINDTVSVTYTGKFIDGTIFAQSGSTPITSAVSGFIEGWKIGLQKIAKGGQIKLVIPSSLAYGCQGYYTIPPNAILYFDLTITEVIQVP